MSEIVKQRVSEDPANFQALFDAARDAADATFHGQLEAGEATAGARNNSGAATVLGLDIKARVADHRLAPRDVTRRQIGTGDPAS